MASLLQRIRPAARYLTRYNQARVFTANYHEKVTFYSLEVFCRSCISTCRILKMIYSRSFLYYSQVIDHYENPRNVGSLDKGDTSVGTGLVGAPACGDVMKLQVCACMG